MFVACFYKDERQNKGGAEIEMLKVRGEVEGLVIVDWEE